MKYILIIFTAFSLLFTSCSKVENPANEEVQIRFSANLEYNAGTKAGGELSGYKVVCAVFDGEKELDLREVVDVVNGACEYAPRLVKGKTYSVVFWAMKVFESSDNGNNGSYASYDVADLKSITRKVSTSEKPLVEADYDAFTSVEVITVEGEETTPVTLKRPLAQLNFAVGKEDYAAVEKLGATPSKMEITVKNCRTAFNAFEGKATGSSSDYTYTVASSGSEYKTDFKHIGMCYVFSNSSQENFEVTCNIYGKADVENAEEELLRGNVQMNGIPLQRNFCTNILGDLITGTVNYNVLLNPGFIAAEN